MQIILHALTFDPLGVVDLDCTPDSTMGEHRRRMNRVATLDGGAVFNDFGFSEADRTCTAARGHACGPVAGRSGGVHAHRH